MILGMPTFTFVHVLLSLIAIFTGLIVVYGFLKSRSWGAWTALFLLTTIATSATGFGFPSDRILPSHIVGAISLFVLAIALLAYYAFHLVRRWRSIYVVTAMLSLYLNVLVLVVQAFLKVPELHALAPTQNEPPFAIAQGIVLVVFIAVTARSVKTFHP